MEAMEAWCQALHLTADPQMMEWSLQLHYPDSPCHITLPGRLQCHYCKRDFEEMEQVEELHGAGGGNVELHHHWLGQEGVTCCPESECSLQSPPPGPRCPEQAEGRHQAGHQQKQQDPGEHQLYSIVTGSPVSDQLMKPCLCLAMFQLTEEGWASYLAGRRTTTGRVTCGGWEAPQNRASSSMWDM